MIASLRNFLLASLLLAIAQAFAPVAQQSAFLATTASSSSVHTPTALSLQLAPLETFASSSSLQISVETLDPTTVLSDVLGAFLGTPLILAVPIVAALGIAGLVAFAIVSYANPAADDDDE